MLLSSEIVNWLVEKLSIIRRIRRSLNIDRIGHNKSTFITKEHLNKLNESLRKDRQTEKDLVKTI